MRGGVGEAAAGWLACSLTLPLLRNGSLPLPQAGEGLFVLVGALVPVLAMKEFY
ncbi:hypothetical protein SAE02_56320 [Skermanella aerolata]|uniref:Uncharacterized protein n=1 Tax=Skermanella aerolata TaxID=393310 RepID=A0A512DYE2_9PROT|nr:hypothetical protein N826_18210 [Skermanella aerolata KACC 11604]GEO41484.1 hypothetical protein SAE02_56320 [Skermanella aerolata]